MVGEQLQCARNLSFEMRLCFLLAERDGEHPLRHNDGLAILKPHTSKNQTRRSILHLVHWELREAAESFQSETGRGCANGPRGLVDH